MQAHEFRAPAYYHYGFDGPDKGRSLLLITNLPATFGPGRTKP